MTYPTAAVVTTDMDAGTDSPATARSALLDAVQKLNQMIAHTTAFAATLLDDANAAAARATLGAAASGNNADVTSWSGGPLAGLRNRIINGNFGINQRTYVSGAAVGANLYGHDRWKMAVSGDTYTFSTTANVTTITIPASKVLRQVIEGLNLETGTYTLSWVGTAQGKIGGGSLGASGITGSITGGTDTTIEFGPGTVSKVQLEFGSVATAFEQRPHGMELGLCQRYYYRIAEASASTRHVGLCAVMASSWAFCAGQFPVSMRIPPTLTTSATATDYKIQTQYNGLISCNSVPYANAYMSVDAFNITFYAAAMPAGQAAVGFIVGPSGFLGFSAEL